MSNPSSTQMLRRTKLHRPRVAGDLIRRPRLEALLDDGLALPLILVAAPAGFGKSTLANAWLETVNLPSAWLSLDASDNNLGVFIAYLLAAIRSIIPNSMVESLASVTGLNLPPVEVLADSLINEMDALNRDFVLVLDDYHVIQDEAVHEMLSSLLQHPPRGLRLVILTRRDPPLGLGLLRARNQLAEIRAHDLRFSAPEVTAFTERALGAPLAKDAVAVLTEKTEGWAAGLRLAMLTLRHHGNAEAGLAGLHAENRYVLDYLMHEVLSTVPSPMAAFLLKTSILDQLSTSLCEAVIGPEVPDCDPQAALEWLEANGMFTVALDAQGQWYRYHHLFRELLFAQLTRQSGVDEITTLHQRASAWFARKGYLEEALRHAIAGHDMVLAAQLMAEHRHTLLDSEQWQRLERCLQMFPPEAIADHPDLLLATAWLIELNRADRQHVTEIVDRAAGLVAGLVDQPARVSQLLGEIDSLRSMEAADVGTEPEIAVGLARRALANTPRSWYLVRAVAWLRQALAHQTAGRLGQAYATLAEAAPEDVAPDGAVRARSVGGRCFVAWIGGDLRAISQPASRLTDIGRTHNRRESQGWGHYFLGSVAYQHNDLAAAEAHALAVEAIRYLGRPMTYLQSAFIFASTHQALGRPADARQKIDMALDFLDETHSEGLVPLAQAFQAELAARQGDLASARHWTTAVGPFVPLALMPFFYVPQLTLPKLLLLEDTPASLKQADALLSRLYAFVTTTHNTRFTIEVMALQALLQDIQGDERLALALLRQALSLAKPGGFIRLFVDLGPQMASLLARLPRAGVAPAYVAQILDAFGQATPAPPSLEGAVSYNGHSDLVEPLTEREREVLELLAQRLTNKEIAQGLVITTATVKRHTTNIYHKLQASDRRDVVAIATRLGLL